MGDMVIVAYRPKPGREEDLLALTREHVPALRRLGLATERPALAMRAKSGDVVEVFEWREGATARARELRGSGDVGALRRGLRLRAAERAA